MTAKLQQLPDSVKKTGLFSDAVAAREALHDRLKESIEAMHTSTECDNAEAHASSASKQARREMTEATAIAMLALVKATEATDALMSVYEASKEHSA